MRQRMPSGTNAPIKNEKNIYRAKKIFPCQRLTIIAKDVIITQ